VTVTRGAGDAQFAQLVVERRARQTEVGGGAGGAANHPVRGAQHPQDVFALDGRERGGGGRSGGGVRIMARSTRFCSSRMLPGHG
jgi:hypothetical protein